MSVLACLFFTLIGCAHSSLNRDVLFQTSTINALLEGVYDGEMTIGQLKKHGDFGIGTFNHLDGEMLELGGTVYQIKVDGKVYRAADSDRTPLAMVTFFEADRTATLERSVDLIGLEEFLNGLMPSRNIFYAITVEGTFISVKARSVPPPRKNPTRGSSMRRSDRPYSSLKM